MQHHANPLVFEKSNDTHKLRSHTRSNAEKVCGRLLSGLKQCSCLRDLETGKKFHSQAEELGLLANRFVISSLIKMYSSCGSMSDAQKVFDSCPSPLQDIVSWNALIGGYVRNNQSELALELFHILETQQDECDMNSRTIGTALSACVQIVCQMRKHADFESCSRCLDRGVQIYSRALASGSCDIFVENTVLDLFARCGMMVEARTIFDQMSCHDSVSWNVLFQGYLNSAGAHLVLEMFENLDKNQADERTYGVALSACGASGSREELIKKGKMIHTRALENQFCSVNLARKLVEFYSRSGMMCEAQRVFDSISSPSVSLWNALFSAYAENGEHQLVLKLFDAMKTAGAKPDGRSFVSAIQSCAALGNEEKKISDDASWRWLQRGKSLHLEAIMQRCSDVYVENSLMEMFSKCGCMLEARCFFGRMLSRDRVSWNVLLQAHVENEQHKLALEAFNEMIQDGFAPDSRTYVIVFSACTALALSNKQYLELATSLHSEAISNGCCSSFVENAVVGMYARLGFMDRARQVFDTMNRRDVVAWTSLLHGYVESGEAELALKLFSEMSGDGWVANARTYTVALSACSKMAERDSDRERGLQTGRLIHSEAAQKQCCDMIVENNLIDMYSRFNCMREARGVFNKMNKRDIVSWNALLQGYIDNGGSDSALELFQEMRGSCLPNARTYVCVLSACSRSTRQQDNYTAIGKCIHREIIKNNHSNDVFLQSTLIDFYSKCGAVELARTVFDSIAAPSSVSWTSLIMGYVENRKNQLALEMLSRMNEGCATPRGSLDYIAAFIACGNLTDAKAGKMFHGDVQRCGLEDDEKVANSMLDFYGKCKNLDACEQVFDSIISKSVVSWTCLMCGHSLQGDASRVFELYGEMRELGIQPSEVTFVCLLSCCAHAGLVERGRECFSSMLPLHGICPALEHYSCMVDMLGRANHLNEAMELMGNMPFEPDGVMWTAVLSASEKFNNAGVGKLAYNKLMAINNRDGAACVLIANASKSSFTPACTTSTWAGKYK